MSHRLAKLNTQHRAAARLKVEGRSIAQISEALGVTPRTLHVWFSDQSVKDEVARLLERVEDVYIEKMATAGLAALSELTDFATMPAGRVRVRAECKTCGYVGETTSPHGTADPKCDGPWRVVETEYIGESTKLDAIREILDRQDRTTRLKDRVEAQKAANGEGAGFQQILNVVQGASDAQLAELLNRWHAQHNGDSPNGTAPVLSA